MLLGYNTNGLAHHDVFDAIALLAEIGYRSVAITIDHGVLAPSGNWRKQLRRLRSNLRSYGMRSVIETGARFLLDPDHKHEPTLVSATLEERARRMDFYTHAVRCAAALGSDCVSLWSGTLRQPIPHQEAMPRLAADLGDLARYAAENGVTIGFEPEPGMLVDSMARFAELLSLVDEPNLKLTLDVGHLQCQGELPIADQVRRWAPRLVNVHLEDMRRGKHEHLMFGEGQIDFPPVLQALAEVGYQGGVHVELSRHSHEAPTAARRAYEFLQPMIERIRSSHG
jgi:sugar phosphate isomerase/epimerase